jgi:cold shock CspA family protein
MSILDASYQKLSPPRVRDETSLFMRAMDAECDRIKDSDPSLVGGYSIVYDREVPFEIRAADVPGDENAGAYEGLMVKILVQNSSAQPHNNNNGSSQHENDGSSSSGFTSLRVELSSETDLFFHYTCAINYQGYSMLREDQKLTCDFRDFLRSLINMFNRCINEPQSLVAVILLSSDATATLQIIQNFDYKLVEVLSLPFRESPTDLVRCHVEYRYRAIRSRLAIMTSKLHDVAALVKVKDTALLPVLQKAAAADQH